MQYLAKFRINELYTSCISGALISFISAFSPMDGEPSGCEPCLASCNSWPRQWPGFRRAWISKQWLNFLVLSGLNTLRKIILSAKLLNTSCCFTELSYPCLITWEVVLSIPLPVMSNLLLGNEIPSQILPEYYHRSLNTNKQEESTPPEVWQNQLFNF